MFWVLLTSLLSLTTALQWTDSLTNNTVLTSCSSSDLHLPWNFTLSPDERIEDIKWIYRAEDGSEELIAMFVAGHFNPMPAFSNRVQWTGQAGIVVSQRESGHYTVEVSTGDTAQPLIRYTKTVHVQVADPPTAENGELQVRQESEAVHDNTTGQWRVQLSCGVFTSLGQPAVHAVWTTPEGHTVESSSEVNGTFRLLLPNPSLWRQLHLYSPSPLPSHTLSPATLPAARGRHCHCG